MTKDQIAIMAHNYKNRIQAIDAAIICVKNYGYDNYNIDSMDEIMTLEIMSAEYSDKLDNLSIDKEYHISFEGGGWNTTQATNDEDALKFAKAEYDGEHTKVKTVFVSTGNDRERMERVKRI